LAIYFSIKVIYKKIKFRKRSNFAKKCQSSSIARITNTLDHKRLNFIQLQNVTKHRINNELEANLKLN